MIADLVLRDGYDSNGFNIVREISCGGFPTINNAILLKSKTGAPESYTVAKGHMQILPSGFIETPLECATREIYEELNLDELHQTLTPNGFECYLRQELEFARSKEHAFKTVILKGFELNRIPSNLSQTPDKHIELLSFSDCIKYAQAEILPHILQYEKFLQQK